MPVFYLLVTRGILNTCTGFSLSHLIALDGPLGATLAGTTEPALQREPSSATPDGFSIFNIDGNL